MAQPVAANGSTSSGYMLQTPDRIIQILQMLRDGAMKVPKLIFEHHSAISNQAAS